MIRLKDIFIQEKKSGPSKSFNKLATNFQKEAVKHQDLVDKQKSLAKQFVDEKNSTKKEKIKQELLKHHRVVKKQEKVMKSAEQAMMNALDREEFDYDI